MPPASLIGYQNTVHKDKFLIMAMEVANESGESLIELWKSAQRESIMEHRYGINIVMELLAYVCSR